MNGLTLQLGDFVAGLKHTTIPGVCLDVARLGFTDCIGVLIAGAQEPAPRTMADLVHSTQDARHAPQIPSGRCLSPGDAALVNGVSAHVLDYDDVALSGHPSAVLVPAILAEGWAQHSAGKDMLAAYVAGYETWALIEALDPGSYHDRGFHPTAVCGTLACAAACAVLRGLSAQQASYAIAISASLASGLVANFGTMTKSLHIGRAAQSGILAADLASRGYTGSLDVLEHRTGFMRAHTPSSPQALTLEGDHALGKHWRIAQTGLHIKRYPICYATHRSIDAMRDLVQVHQLTPENVQNIHVETGEVQYLMLRNHFPQTGLEAKFSMQFAMASALVAHQVGLAQLIDRFVQRADVKAVMQKVTVSTTPERALDWDAAFAPQDQVSVTLTSGMRVASEPVRYPKGSWQKPLSRDELREKFLDCAHGAPQAAPLFNQLWHLDQLASVRDLGLLQPMAKCVAA